MPEIYTANDLIRFIYNETSPSEAANIQHLIQHNTEAKGEYTQLLETAIHLPSVELNAHPTSIELIMEYARKQTKELI